MQKMTVTVFFQLRGGQAKTVRSSGEEHSSLGSFKTESLLKYLPSPLIAEKLHSKYKYLWSAAGKCQQQNCHCNLYFSCFIF